MAVQHGQDLSRHDRNDIGERLWGRPGPDGGNAGMSEVGPDDDGGNGDQHQG